LVLAAVVIGILVLLAAPLHRYFASRADVNNAARELQTDQSQLATLKHQQALWSDPGFIQEQARVQLQYAMPGDTVYVVVRPGQSTNAQSGAPNSSTQPTGSTWATRLWGSVQAADAAP
jgi:cell division protein FtsB